MDSTVAVHTKGLGSWFQSLRNASMDACRSGNTPLHLGDAEEDATTDSLVVQVAEPSLDKIHPTGTGGDEVGYEYRIAFQPCLYVRVLVLAVVVHDQVEWCIAREFGIKPAQELQKLLMPVSRMTFANDLALQGIQGGEQGGRPVALVIVGHCAASTLLDGQPRLGAIQCLNLALFVYA